MAANSNCSPVPNGPFRATRIWNTLIHHLQENANIKKRRNVKKCCDECFTGTNAVDVLHHFVRLNPGQFTNSAAISRENIVRLCQSFLDNGIFELIGSDSDKHAKFEDSTSALYIFTEKSQTGSESNTKSLGGRQVLREIDGEIRNSLGHISISSRQKSKHENTTPKSKSILIPTRSKTSSHSRFPSFGGISAQSLKETFLLSVQGSESEDDSNDNRRSRRLKRTSSVVGLGLKRSSSESNLRHEASSTSSSSDTESKDKKSDIGRGGKLRLSQRLSFRKKSLSSNNQIELVEAKKVDPDRITAQPPAHLNLPQRPETREQHHPVVPRGSHCFDSRRRSMAVKNECSKPRRSLRRMLSSPTLISRKIHWNKQYNVTEQESNAAPRPMETYNNEDFSRIVPTPTNRRLQSTHEIGGSPPKMMKKDAIKETPSRFKSSKPSTYLSSLAGFAQRVSAKRKSMRRSDHSSTNIGNSCVIKNPSVGHENKQTKSEEKPIDASAQRKLLPQEISHIRRECVRVRLLQILDLQFVDSLITSPTFDKKNPSDAMNASSGSSNTQGVQYSEVVAAYNSEDEWIASALAVLQHLPNGYQILCMHARHNHYMKKIKLFYAISDYYKSLSKPLIDDSMSEIVDAIIQMLATKPINESLEAIQLFLHLLSDARLYELRDLFNFLHCVATSNDVALTPQCKNKTLIMETFPSMIFPSAEKTTIFDHSCGLNGFTLFVMEQRQQAFKLPAAIAATINRKRKLLEAGEVDSPSLVPDSTFCAMITSKEYNRQRVEFTRKQVSELARLINTDQAVPPRKKKDFLKKLQSSHPSAYERSRGPVKAPHTIPASQADAVLQHPHHQPVIRAPSSDPLSRRRNKSRKQVYV